MRRLISSFAVFTMVVATPGLVSAAYAHGGSYQPPAGEVPPGTREPSDPPPPPEGGTPQTPGGEQPGGPQTPGGPDAGGPSTPGGTGGGPGGTGGPSGPPPGTGGGPGGGPSTGAAGTRGSAKSSALSGWAYWWAANKDELIQMKSAVWRTHRGSFTGSEFGRSRGAPVRTVTDRAISERIVPALRALLADESQSFHIRSAAELGLAKIGDDTIVATLKTMALDESNSVHREIEETAALALGLMQRDDAATRAFLIDIVRSQSKDGSFVRPFSAISLGLLGGRDDREHSAMSALLEVVARKEAGADIKPACLSALGLLGNDAAVPELVAMVRNGRASARGAVELNEIETAYAVAALGKIGRAGTATDAAGVLDEIVRIVGKDRSRYGQNVRRSATIALGQIGARCTAKQQREIVDLLKQVSADSTDEQERNFAVMSLGRIGASKSVEPAERRDVVAAVGRLMEKGRGQTPAFAAMALGIVGRAIVDGGDAAPEEEIRAPLRARFGRGGDSQLRGAFALASGLVRDPLAVGSLLETLEDRGEDKRVRGWSALALGLIGAREATAAIRVTLNDYADRDLRVQSAMAAGLLGDADVIADVVGVIKSPDSSNYELGSAALALGQIGDERAIDALLEIAVDASKTYPDLTRALAVVALGQIGDRRDVPTLARLGVDVNYRAHVPAITELLSIL